MRKRDRCGEAVPSPGRNTLVLVLVLMLLLQPMVIGGCGSSAATENNENLVIATSFYPIYIMTRNVTHDIPGVEVVNITRTVTGCLHDYHLTTSDLKRLHEADILVVNGAGMESFLDQAARQRPGLKIVNASRGISLLKDRHGEENAHVWVSVSLAMKQVQNIADQLAGLDIKNGPAYQENASRYISELKALRTEMHEELEQIPNRDIVTFHEAFPYFAHEFGLNIVAVVEREPGSEPSAAELAETIEIIRQSGVKAIFVEPQYSTKAAETIARETGSRIYTLDPVVSGPDDPGAYIEIMRRNLQVLVEALSES
ncbi:MAG: metal ABC transporter substrate-binding protein [Bacillota bacterium]